MMRRLPLLLALGWCGAAHAAPPVDFQPKLSAKADGTPVVVLTASPCLITEAEKDPIPYGAKDAATCERLKRATLPVREPGFKRMRLKAGKYVFRILNRDVPWPVDFALKGAHDPSLPKTGGQGGGAPAGQGLDYAVELKAGVYVYASPGNGTPEYPLLVEE